MAKSGGAVITHYEGLVEGEDYVLVRGGFDGEDSEACELFRGRKAKVVV